MPKRSNFIYETTPHKLKVRDTLWSNWPVPFKGVQAIERQQKTEAPSQAEGVKETRQLNTAWEPGQQKDLR